LSDYILEELVSIVGRDNASDDPAVLDAYSTDQSLVLPRRPNYVAMPGSVEEVQEIVRLANRYMTPLVPYSSGTNFHGVAIPDHGGILVNLGRMNNILGIDERNWNALVEPGVTYSQLQGELQKRKLRVAAPLSSPPSASVLSSYLERTPVITAADFTFGNELINTYDIVMPTGQLFTVGHPPSEKASSMAPDGPALNLYRLFQGAQGTMGIVVRMSIRLLPLPEVQNVFFVATDSVKRAVPVIQRIQRKELGLECFALNSFDLAALLTEGSSQDENPRKGRYVRIQGVNSWTVNQSARFKRLRETLPPWTVVISLAGWGRRSGEKVEYQELDLRDLAAEYGFEIERTVGDVPNLDRIIREEVLHPWRMQKRFGYRGSCQGLMFHARPDRVPQLAATISEVASKYQYPPGDIGGYLLPIERARAIYAEYDFHFRPDDPADTLRLKELFEEASELLIDRGAFFDRPYGTWAKAMYHRAGTYTEYLRRVKRQLDPNNIMNPGKLCF